MVRFLFDLLLFVVVFLCASTPPLGQSWPGFTPWASFKPNSIRLFPFEPSQGPGEYLPGRHGLQVGQSRRGFTQSVSFSLSLVRARVSFSLGATGSRKRRRGFTGNGPASSPMASVSFVSSVRARVSISLDTTSSKSDFLFLLKIMGSTLYFCEGE